MTVDFYLLKINIKGSNYLQNLKWRHFVAVTTYKIECKEKVLPRTSQALNTR